MGLLQRIRQKIVDREYYLSAHAEEEMWAEALERKDVEHAILKGELRRNSWRTPGYEIQNGRPQH